jgi:hypothetical protein
MKILPFPRLLAVGICDIMADLERQDQWRPIMAALRRAAARSGFMHLRD